jgi:protein-S-isoprenylcysteine O-methyltransferase Ste14
MRAAKWEFEYRFFVIGAIFFLGFFLYNVDPVPFSVALIRIAAPSVDLDREGILWFKLLIAFGALLVFLSALFRTWATAYLRTEVVHDAPLHAEALVADGPYRYVRNPLYFANVPMAAGMGLMASRAGWFFMVKTQGEPYRAYLRAVPRFWPALTARVAPGGRPARWAQAFAGEMFIWLIGAAELCFAITLNLKLSGIVLAGSFVVYFLAVYLVKKSAGQSAPSA